MTGLALEGGGVRGSYQAGVYMAMYEYGIKIDGVCGTSIGALNGAVIASGKGEYLPEIWRSLNIGRVFGFSDPFVDALNSKTFNINLAVETMANLFRIILNKGIELNGVKEVIDKYLDIDNLINNKIDFGLCTVKLKDLKPLYIYKEDMTKDKIKDYILASCYLPIFKMEKIIDDNYYLDGGFYDLGPVNMLLKKGYEKIYLVKVHGIGITRSYDESANVCVIESKRSLGGVIELNKNQVEENIKMGYYDALRIIKNYDGEKYVFKRHNEKYYKQLNKKIKPYLYRRVKNFFKAKSYKETTIRALEYIMEQVGINYYKIYSPYKIIKYLNKNFERDNFIYKYVSNLKLFI